MLDIGWPELMIILVVAVVVIGPKDLPKTMYTVGKWVRAARRMTGQMQRQFDDAMREAELDEIRKGLKGASPSGIKKKIENTIDPTGTLSKATDITSGKSVKQYLKDGLTGDDKAEDAEASPKAAGKPEAGDPHIKGDEGADKVAAAGVQESGPGKPAKSDDAGEGENVTPALGDTKTTRKKATVAAVENEQPS
ncbi:MAG: Sec-independent protein translocase protein TatB [Pseudomonadota bacterium]